MSQEPNREALVHYNRGCALQAEHDLRGAIAAYDEALALQPDLAAAHSNRGAALAGLNDCDAALASLERAIVLQPGYAEAHFSRAITLLLKGDLPAGWAEFEWRWQTVPGRALRQAKNFPQPLWLGQEAVAGRTVLLHCERGLGDTLQFCRYAQLVAQARANVILQVQDPLVELLRGSSGPVQVIGESQPLPYFDLQCPLLSLPLAFNTPLATIPAPRRYLRAASGDVAQMWAALQPLGVPRVGLVWRGDAGNPDDRNRSIALRELLAFLPPGLSCFSLQKRVTPPERLLIEAHPHVSILREELSFEATAALCECLDLVVAIDTSVAHLAAAVGTKTWILLPFNPDCRWLLEREDSPWYPTVQLYRQSQSGNWHAVLARIRAELERMSPR